MPVNNELTHPRVTVFIPAYNEEKLIGKTLDLLKDQDYEGEYELMVVDNASTDSTAEIAGRSGARVIREEAKGNRFAVERGFAEAKGEIVVQTDADSRPTREFLRRILEPYSDPNVVASGTRIKFFDCSPLINILYKVAAILNPRESMWGPSLSARKWAWKKVGGFNKGFDINADGFFTLCLRKVGKVAIIYHYYLPVSGRRYNGNFFEVFMNSLELNVSSVYMVLTGKPLIKRPFKDIR